MIQKLLNIAKIAQSTQNSSVKNFNTTLPLLLTIIQKSKMGYMLKLGNTTIEAKSNANLQIGAKYWAIVKDVGGELLISKLKMRPKIAESAKNSPIKYELENLMDFFKNAKFAKSADFVSEFYENIIDKITNAKFKDDFTFLANSLFALQKGILNLAIKDGMRDILLQIKRQKNDKIDFSAIFSNLGIINGSIYKNEILQLIVQYENVKKLLDSNKNALDFNEIHIALDENCEILFDERDETTFSA